MFLLCAQGSQLCKALVARLFRRCGGFRRTISGDAVFSRTLQFALGLFAQRCFLCGRTIRVGTLFGCSNGILLRLGARLGRRAGFGVCFPLRVGVLLSFALEPGMVSSRFHCRLVLCK